MSPTEHAKLSTFAITMDDQVYSLIHGLGHIGEGLHPADPHASNAHPILLRKKKKIHSARVLMNDSDTIDLVKKTLCFAGQSAIECCSKCDQYNEQRCYDCPRELTSLRDNL